ncbi:hypothetical protein VTL71DRAFT_13186 [Oculimacula yallundae]|uniref:Proteophosphoglycan ppg4 n=1 Tax=Oculimacula yallundae TaxID=86028 RepID=A0ABR4CJL8_9HELO
MASIVRSFFSSKSSTKSSNTRVKGHSYDSAVALDPPVKGSYPVAGNGPSVLEELQRSRAQRETSSARPQTGVAAPPNIPRYREEIIPRPRTAPNDGTSNESHNRRNSRTGSMSWVGRTRSGFSSKSPPSIFRSSSQKSRHNSMRSNAEYPLPAVPVLHETPVPQVYQPKKGLGPGSEAPSGFTPPFAQHMRNTSTSSHKSYVDLLEAHSSIRPETSKHRAKASGVRDYGEDVADRNINRFGSSNTAQLDLNSPQFSYMKTVYAPKKQPLAGVAEASKPRPGSHSRVSSALGHVLGEDEAGDDIPPRGHGKSPSLRSTASVSRPYPIRTESPSIVSYSSVSRGRARNEPCPPPLSALPPQDQKARALSPLSQSSTTSTQPVMRKTLRKLLQSKYNSNESSNQSPTQSQLLGEKSLREPPPVAASIARPQSLPQDEDTAAISNGSINHTVKRMPAMPASNESSVYPPAKVKSSSNGHRKSKSGSGMIIENSSLPPNLDGVLDLSNTVDTDVITKTLPAVTHEHVTPIQREIIEEQITREIHTHEVRHHILPVIDTEILPAKHYINSPDGKGLIEIPEPQVPEHKLTGRMNGNWALSRTPRSRANSLAQNVAHYRADSDEYESAEAPVIGLARGEPKPRSRASSRASNHIVRQSRSLKNLFTEPILVSKKEYMTEDHFPRTEYLWRHPPVFEDAMGRTQPIIIGAGFGNPNAPRQEFLEDSVRYEDQSAMRSPTQEESLFFRDSGYGSLGMLPGLSPRSPISDNVYGNDASAGDYRGYGNSRGAVGSVDTTSNAESEAKRARNGRSAGISEMGASHMREEDFVKGLSGMHV